jgi:hypothetical protein
MPLTCWCGSGRWVCSTGALAPKASACGRVYINRIGPWRCRRINRWKNPLLPTTLVAHPQAQGEDHMGGNHLVGVARTRVTMFGTAVCILAAVAGCNNGTSASVTSGPTPISEMPVVSGASSAVNPPGPAIANPPGPAIANPPGPAIANPPGPVIANPPGPVIANPPGPVIANPPGPVIANRMGAPSGTNGDVVPPGESIMAGPRMNEQPFGPESKRRDVLGGNAQGSQAPSSQAPTSSTCQDKSTKKKPQKCDTASSNKNPPKTNPPKNNPPHNK